MVGNAIQYLPTSVVGGVHVYSISHQPIVDAMDRRKLCHLHRGLYAGILRFLLIRLLLPYRSRRFGVKQGWFIHPLPLVFLLCLYFADRHGARPFQLFHVHFAIRALRGYRQGEEKKTNGNHANMVFLLHHGRSVAQQWLEGFHVGSLPMARSFSSPSISSWASSFHRRWYGE